MGLVGQVFTYIINVVKALKHPKRGFQCDFKKGLSHIGVFAVIDQSTFSESSEWFWVEGYKLFPYAHVDMYKCV